jgi:hypothetical protein
MARSVTAFVSAHQRTRCHVSSFVRGDVFTLGANFTACLDDATITQVVWRVDNPQSVVLGSGDIADGLATISCTAGMGNCRIKALATLSDGRKFSQLYSVGVKSSPWFADESAPAAGSASVTVTA